MDMSSTTPVVYANVRARVRAWTARNHGMHACMHAWHGMHVRACVRACVYTHTCDVQDFCVVDLERQGQGQAQTPCHPYIHASPHAHMHTHVLMPRHAPQMGAYAHRW